MPPHRLNDIKPFFAMEILERAQELERSGIDCIHLEVGEPDFPVPDCVRDALADAMNSGCTHYTHSLGEHRFREAVSREYSDSYGVKVEPERVVITQGTSPAMLVAFSALIEPGDEVLLPDPGYPCYANIIRFLGGIPVAFTVREENGFVPDREEIRRTITDKTRAIIVNSPANPTGAVLDEDTMAGLSRLPLTIVSDEIYHGLTYGKHAHSMLEFTPDAFVLNGFSKRYAMTGLRLGYLIAPKEYIRRIQLLQQNLFICANTPVQAAGIAALTQAAGDAERMRCEYDSRRRYMIDRLRGLGFGIEVEPAGAFYVFVNARHVDGDSLRLASDILDNAHVGVTPGMDFGMNGEGFLRFSYTASLDAIDEGMNRLKRYLERMK